ncbi:MAG: hypothetical protein ACM3SQ_06900 [Betaproteobacteria bacterium]
MTRAVVLLCLLTAVAACSATPPPAQPPLVPASLTPIPVARDESHDFARVFCSTLPHTKDRDGGAWGDCAKYIEPAEPPAPLKALTAPYRFLLVGGFGDGCFRNTRAFSTAAAHLHDAHQVDVDLFAVAPFASSEENGKSIARQIDAGWTSDQSRRYVLIGYDKGAPDLLEALRLLAEPASKVAALVTVAGAVGGVWRPDAVLALVNPSKPWMADQCPGNQADGMHSLLRDVRLRFLRENPLPVHAYSIVASSQAADTSSALRQSWKSLSIYAADEDGVMLAWDAVLPEATFLGSLKADHWAVALPFDAAPKPPKSIDQNRFPRDALLEALVRYVSEDLQHSEKR